MLVYLTRNVPSAPIWLIGTVKFLPSAVGLALTQMPPATRCTHTELLWCTGMTAWVPLLSTQSTRIGWEKPTVIDVGL